MKWLKRRSRRSKEMDKLVAKLGAYAPNQVIDNIPQWIGSNDKYYPISDRKRFSDRHLLNALHCCRKKNWCGVNEVVECLRQCFQFNKIDWKCYSAGTRELCSEYPSMAIREIKSMNEIIMVDILRAEIKARGLKPLRKSLLFYEQMWDDVKIAPLAEG